MKMGIKLQSLAACSSYFHNPFFFVCLEIRMNDGTVDLKETDKTVVMTITYSQECQQQIQELKKLNKAIRDFASSRSFFEKEGAYTTQLIKQIFCTL
jgi:hypothetical protein